MYNIILQHDSSLLQKKITTVGHNGPVHFNYNTIILEC